MVTVSSKIASELRKNVKDDFSVTQVRFGLMPKKVGSKKLSNFFNKFKKKREIILVRADSSLIEGKYYLAAFDAKTHDFMGVRPVVACENTHTLNPPTIPPNLRNKGVLSVLTAEAIKNASEAGVESISTGSLSNKGWAKHLAEYLGGVKYEYGESRVFWSEKELQSPNAKWRYFLLQEKPTPEGKLKLTLQKMFKKTVSQVK